MDLSLVRASVLGVRCEKARRTFCAFTPSCSCPGPASPPPSLLPHASEAAAFPSRTSHQLTSFSRPASARSAMDAGKVIEIENTLGKLDLLLVRSSNILDHTPEKLKSSVPKSAHDR